MKPKQKTLKIGENNINYLSSNFKEWFEEMKFSLPEKFQPLTSKKLHRSMNDTEILAELKPEEITLADLYETLKIMDRDMYALFYIKDKNGVLRTVDVGWYGAGWDVYASEVSYPYRWGGGGQVFSRNWNSDTLTSDSVTLVHSDALILSKNGKDIDIESLKNAMQTVKDAGYVVYKIM